MHSVRINTTSHIAARTASPYANPYYNKACGLQLYRHMCLGLEILNGCLIERYSRCAMHRANHHGLDSQAPCHPAQACDRSAGECTQNCNCSLTSSHRNPFHAST
eukprot:1326425-Pleurochrysis_carterae.AAC.1